VPVHEALLAGQEDVAEGTRAFRFAKPAGFVFKPGQSVSLELIDPPARPNSARRVFSLASAPSDEELVVASRMREGSAYKQALKALPAGAKVRIRGPLGVMTLHDDAARAAVFVAGGIGITPFMSMLRQAAHESSSRPLRLVYSNRRPEDAPFLDELLALERRLADFRMLATMTDMEHSARPWHGPRGLVTQDTVRRFVAEAPAPVYYLAGPPAMVEAMAGVLAGSGTRDFDVRSERFYGY
jgi:ferredoxin-NADP reductase